MVQEVLIYHSEMAGAPTPGQLTLEGSVIAILDACLVNGFNAVGLASLNQTGGVATAHTLSNHNFSVNDWIDQSGAVQAAYNGRFQILAKTANTYQFNVPSGTTATATGTITAKHPAAGWTKPFSGDNAGVYKTKAGSSLGIAFQINDNMPHEDPYGANVFTMRQIFEPVGYPDSGTQLGEAVEQAKVIRGGVADSVGGVPYTTAHGWVLVADHKTCYLIFCGNVPDLIGYQPSMHWTMVAFGEFKSFNSSDAYSSFMSRGLAASTVAAVGTPGVISTTPNVAGTSYPFFQCNALCNDDGSMGATILRNYAGIAASVKAWPMFAGHVIHSGTSTLDNNRGYAMDPAEWTVPDPVNNSVPLTPVFIVESPRIIRGRHRGIYVPMGTLSTSLFLNNMLRLDETIVDGATRQVALVRVGRDGRFQLAFDLSPSWG